MLSRHSKRAILGILFAGILLVVIGAASRHYFAARALEIRLEEERAELVPPEPMLLEVKRMSRARERSYAVRLQPFKRSTVAAEASGRVDTVLVEIGDSVEQGEVLIQLDDELARLNAESAEAALEAGEAQLRELRRRVREAERLAEAASIPETQLEEVRSRVEVQEREIERLRAESRLQLELLARHEIRAPFAGNVNQRLVEEGESVNLNQGLLSLVTLDPLRVRFSVSDIEVDSFQVGDGLRLTLSAYPGEEFEVPVVSVAKAADPVNGMFLVEARLANPDERFSGGVQGEVQADIVEYTEHLFVPASAVRFEGRRALVEIWSDGDIELREVELGRETEGDYPVLNGLEEDDVLVVR